MTKKLVISIICALLVALSAVSPALAFYFPYTLEEAQEQQKRPIPQGTVLCDTTLRALPEEDAPEVGQAEIGQMLDIHAVNINEAWNAVMMEDGTMAYIRSSEVSLTAPTYEKEGQREGEHSTDGGANGYPGELYNDAGYLKLINEAKKYIGFPYVFGGSTPETSFDCSGYACWVLKKSGTIDLGRTDAQGIYNHCTPIDRDEAKPGDLVFFTRTYDTPNTVTHVAIYVGNDYMLHCGNPIGYNPIDTPYWTEHFYSFGRLNK